VNCCQSPSIAVLALTLSLTCVVSADQVPGRRPTAPLITQGPGSDIRATVRELRDSDQRPEGLGGVVVVEVVRDGPAQRAGLMSEDVITQFDRQAVMNAAQFGRIVRDTPADRTVTVVFVRMGTSRETKITPVFAKPL